MTLQDRVAFVTGAAHGLGAETARRLAADGARVVALDICRDIDDIYALGRRAELDELVAEVSAGGGEAIAVQADVRDFDQMRGAVETALERFETIDILVNNAGVVIPQAVDEITEETLDVVIGVNLRGPFNAVRLIAPVMKRQRHGRIVNVSSIGGLRGLPGVSTYAATKGGLVTVTESWANELAAWNITVNAVAPGNMLTGMISGFAERAGRPVEEVWAQFNSGNLLKGPENEVTVEDVAATIAFLAGDEARSITGHTVPVDAGWLIAP